MDIAAIKQLAQKYSTKELHQMANQLEESGESVLQTDKNPGEEMNDLLQAAEVKKLMEDGETLQTALRSFSKRVRSILK